MAAIAAPPAPSPGSPTRRGVASGAPPAARRKRSRPASCSSTARSSSPATPTRRSTRRTCCASPPPPPDTRRGSAGAASTACGDRAAMARTLAGRGDRQARRRCCSRATPAIPVIEALDQRGLITRMLPEWEPVRSRPQRNAYHRYTVDRHLWETAANASELVDMVDPARPARARRPVPRHRQGLSRRPHRGRRSSSCASSAPRLGFRAARRRRARWRWSRTTCCCPTSPCDATSPIRRRSSSSPTRSATRTCSTCCTRSRSPTPRRPVRRRGARGRRSSSPTSSRA